VEHLRTSVQLAFGARKRSSRRVAGHRPRGSVLKSGKKWRRGWDLNSVAPFILRKLLILHKATIARTATVAQVGYSFGTHSLSCLTFELAALPHAISKFLTICANKLAPLRVPKSCAKSEQRSVESKQVVARLLRFGKEMFLREGKSEWPIC
jgi:hypothetical protein